jgi:hypothetical protein
MFGRKAEGVAAKALFELANSNLQSIIRPWVKCSQSFISPKARSSHDETLPTKGPHML